MGFHLKDLEEHIIYLSASQESLDEAAKEWYVTGLSIMENTCPCGMEIKLNCHISNKVTNNQTIVGSTCVNRFMGLTKINETEIDKVFTGLMKLVIDNTKCPTPIVIKFAKSMGYIYDNEVEFLEKIVKKKSLSEKQEAWRSKIVHRILTMTVIN